MRGADVLVETLVGVRIPYLFTLSGNQILPIFDATIGRDIELVHTRHEATAVHMADGWGRLTEQPGVALLTAGPGHCNGVSALYTARMAESPLLLLSGSSPAGKAGLGVFQDIDQVEIAAPLCKAAWEVTDASNIGSDVHRVWRSAVRAGLGRYISAFPRTCWKPRSHRPVRQPARWARGIASKHNRSTRYSTRLAPPNGRLFSAVRPCPETRGGKRSAPSHS